MEEFWFCEKKMMKNIIKSLLFLKLNIKELISRDYRKEPKQAQGNAVERLGKNLTGIRAMFNHERITPFVCFGSGDDFEEEGIMARISMLNEFYFLNRIYVNKTDGGFNLNYFSPVSMYFRYDN